MARRREEDTGKKAGITVCLYSIQAMNALFRKFIGGTINAGSD
jgi:hypothetical protein